MSIPESYATSRSEHPCDWLGSTQHLTWQTEDDTDMWAQLITTNLKPGSEAGLQKMVDDLRASEQPGSGLIRSMAMYDQKDPTRAYLLVVFESEEKARERENDPKREELLTKA